MSNPTTPPVDSATLGFSGPDCICSRCAAAAHRAAHKPTAEAVAPDLDVLTQAHHAYPTQPRFQVGACWSCGELAPLLPAHEYNVQAPTKAAHRFAVSVLSAWLGGAVTVDSVPQVRARCEAGRYWVEFKPAGSAFIHTEAARSPAEAVARFVQAAR